MTDCSYIEDDPFQTYTPFTERENGLLKSAREVGGDKRAALLSVGATDTEADDLAERCPVSFWERWSA